MNIDPARAEVLTEAALVLVNQVRDELGAPALDSLVPHSSVWGDRATSCPLAASIVQGEDLWQAEVTQSFIRVVNLDLMPGESFLHPPVLLEWRMDDMGRVMSDEVAEFIDAADEGLIEIAAAA